MNTNDKIFLTRQLEEAVDLTIEQRQAIEELVAVCQTTVDMLGEGHPLGWVHEIRERMQALIDKHGTVKEESHE